jgi:hypothetical protein
MLWALALVMLAAPVEAQVTVDSVRAEAVRSRAFIRAAETQLSKVLALLDSLTVGPVSDPEDPAPDPIPDPDPEPTPDPPPSALHPNEPTGLTVIYDNPGTCLLNPSTAVWNTNGYNGVSRIVADPGNPTGSGQAIEVQHPSGRGGGAAKLERWSDLGSTHCGQGYAGGGLREMYVSHRRFFPAGQPACDTGISNGFKFFYFGMHRDAKIGSGANEIYMTGCVNEGLVKQLGGGGTTNDYFFDLRYPPSSGETWHLEMYLTAESANGRGDGEARVYVDGSLVRHLTGVAWSDPTRPGVLFDGMEMYHTQYPLPAGAHHWLEREWYVSGR